MTIALLTIWHVGNYGAELQAYSTIKILHELGYDVKMINIRLSDTDSLSLRQKIYRIVKYCTPAHIKFQKFWNKYIPITRRYRTLEELMRKPPKADIYIVGSDQVWNPQITKELRELFFLNFGDKNIRRISFSSSFGEDNWKHSDLNSLIINQLSQFDLITCREVSGIHILSKEFNIKGKLILDPTLLLSSFDEFLSQNKKKEDTLVYYPLSADNELSSFANSLAKRLNLKLKNINECKYIFGHILWNRPSIEQWVKDIARSQFVLTRSFHGLIFSIIYKRNFAVLRGRNNRTTRLINLLNLLGLQDRLYNDVIELEKAEPWLEEIDYVEVYKKLQVLRKESFDIIQEVL